MKLQFNYTDFKAFQEKLIADGFKKYNGKLHNEDYYLAKTLHKTEDEDGDSRGVLQLFLSVYDFSKYPKWPEFDDTFIHLQTEIHVSRNIDERIDLSIDAYRFNDLKEIEAFSFKFYEFIEANIKEYETSQLPTQGD